MSIYVTDHADALADIRAAGTAVTFTRTTATLDADTDLVTLAATTVAGYAIRIPGNATRYAANAWTLATMPTLLVGTTTFGSAIAPGDTVDWASSTYTVRDVEPLDVDGAGAIISTVVIAL